VSNERDPNAVQGTPLNPECPKPTGRRRALRSPAHLFPKRRKRPMVVVKPMPSLFAVTGDACANGPDEPGEVWAAPVRHARAKGG